MTSRIYDLTMSPGKLARPRSADPEGQVTGRDREALRLAIRESGTIDWTAEDGLGIYVGRVMDALHAAGWRLELDL